MKEAIGGTWLFGLTIAFVALFTTFVSVTTNYSRCFKIKDEIISTIERKHGVNVDVSSGTEKKQGSIPLINVYLNSLGYRSEGKCPSDGACWLGFRVNSNDPVQGYNDTVNYCIAKYAVTYETRQSSDWIGWDDARVDETILNGAIGHPRSAYYHVVVFFKLDWPILRQFFNIQVDGETSIIYLNNDIDLMDPLKTGTNACYN